MTQPNDLAALAEACKRAAASLLTRLCPDHRECSECMVIRRQVATLRTHAAALRAGQPAPERRTITREEVEAAYVTAWGITSADSAMLRSTVNRAVSMVKLLGLTVED